MPSNHANTPAALHWINAQRTRCHRPPLHALPPGIGAYMAHAPRGRLTGLVIDGTNAAAGENTREALPAEVVRFLIEFDPDLAA